MVPFVNAAEGKRLRADARRNRDLLLRAADEVLATRGAEASIDEIAQRAGVGVGTLYRNFPTKEALLQALLSARIEPLTQTARAAADADDPGEAFITLMHRLSAEVANFRALAEAFVASGVDMHAAKETASAELVAAIRVLFDRAQLAGRIRADATVDDVAAMMVGLGNADPALMDPSRRSRCVAMVCDALRVDTRSVLPREGPRSEPGVG